MMTRKYFLIAISVLLASAVASAALAAGGPALAEVRAATAHFQRPTAAQAAGWDLAPGLDHCFENPGVGAMGYHYINTDLLDTELDPFNPEAMVYAPGPNGQLQLGAVEYIVPAQAWDEAGNSAPPSLHRRSFHLNEALGVYVLHAWIWKHNPVGTFEDWNPRVSCP